MADMKTSRVHPLVSGYSFLDDLHFDGMLFMTKEFDTSWFNLKNYDKLNDLDLSGWYDQIIYRRIIQNMIEEVNDLKEFPENQKVLVTQLMTLCEGIKQAPVQLDTRDFVGSWGNNRNAYPFNTYSVRSTPVGYLWYDFMEMVKRINKDIWELRDFVMNNPATEEQVRFYKTPLDLLFYEEGLTGRSSSLLTVNLECSDEQIISDFRHWLTEYRRYNNIYSTDNKFTEKDFREWSEWQLLPYLDLKLIAKAEGRKLTHQEIGELIYPDIYGIELAGRIRRTTHPRAQWLIKASTVTAIEAQLKSLKA